MRVVFGILGALLCVLCASPTWADDLPDVRSKSAVVIDAETGAEIFGKHADEVRPIASTTKIFVAMVVRSRGVDLDGWTEITKLDAQLANGGSRTRLDVGRKFKNRDLIKAMLIASDNRAPTAIGRAAGLSRDQLIAAMNKLAKQLGLVHTRFTDASGLHGNVSTAREMALALKTALDDDVLRAIMAEPSASVMSQDGRARIDYLTTNQPLATGKYDVIGGKTGFTNPAGYCYITAARFHERRVLMAFLGANGKLTRFADFNRVAAWLMGGAPGAKTVKRPSTRASTDEPRVAQP
jgi:serine-type D-Ala-D-Ala endopeptidase (penicillin-binding protein 7)